MIKERSIIGNIYYIYILIKTNLIVWNSFIINHIFIKSIENEYSKRKHEINLSRKVILHTIKMVSYLKWNLKKKGENITERTISLIRQ